MPCLSRLPSRFGGAALLLASVCVSVIMSGACVPGRLDSGSELADGDTSPGGESCSGSERRCEGNNLMVCDGSSFKKQMSCATTQLCDANLGCIDCSPKTPNYCVGDVLHKCNPDGTVGDTVQTCDPGACTVGGCASKCTVAGTDLIYVVDEAYELLSFNPRDDKNEFKLIGKLRCPSSSALDGSGEATPFSMSVDRQGQAWVLYNSGEIFNVSIQDATCKKTGFAVSQKGFDLFGMGFVSDAAGSDKETLFIAGGAYNNLNSGNLGTIDTATLKVTKIGALQIGLQNSPELTGTGAAEAYGYFPGTKAFVAQIDKTTGKNLRSWNLDPVAGGGSPKAWAFAHWGGRFYIFITAQKSQVILLDPATGSNKPITTNATYKIVGAGVSTCAPIVIG